MAYPRQATLTENVCVVGNTVCILVFVVVALSMQPIM
jgi:hypothetical protein